MTKKPIFVAAFDVNPARYGTEPNIHDIVQYLALRTQDDGLENFIVWAPDQLPTAEDIVAIVTGDDSAAAETPPQLAAFADPMVALRAIRARINGEYDHPDLVKLGPLGDQQGDLLAIVSAALGATHAPTNSKD